jgi:hypothetical protein
MNQSGGLPQQVCWLITESPSRYEMRRMLIGRTGLVYREAELTEELDGGLFDVGVSK